jgi:hypothetical protein
VARGPAIASEIRAYDVISGGCEHGRDLVPGGVRPGVAVGQQHRRAATPVAEANPNRPHIQVIDREAVEHGGTSYWLRTRRCQWETRAGNEIVVWQAAIDARV